MSHLTLSSLRQRFGFKAPEVSVDHLIIGGGVIGLAIGHHLTRSFPNKSSYLLERHGQVGQETSSRNSEVIHAGLYYPSDSLKTSLCLRGRKLLYEFCQSNSIPHQKLGKLMISKSKFEEEYLKSLYTKSQLINHDQNLQRQVYADDLSETDRLPILPIKLLDRSEALDLEPDLTHEVGACLLSPETGIVDSHHLMSTLENLIDRCDNGAIVLNTTVVRIDKAESESGWIVQTKTTNPQGVDEINSVLAKCVINCAGLNAHNLYNQTLKDQSNQLRLSFCKGNYYSYTSKKGVGSVNHLIYPTPSFHPNGKTFAGLGTHLTLDLNHKIKFGPDVEWLETPTHILGSQNLSPNDDRLEEVFHSVRSYLPKVELENFTADYSGIRPKLKGLNETQNQMNRSILKIEKKTSTKPDGLEDFFINQSDLGFYNLLGIESPGLTSSLSIAEHLIKSIQKDFWGLDFKKKGNSRVSEIGQIDAWG
ncbi:FAD dependent oxidoreductase [Melampsora americana]|nr:FAD dependent oxidoreductase [Melampsora americana]